MTSEARALLEAATATPRTCDDLTEREQGYLEGRREAYSWVLDMLDATAPQKDDASSDLDRMLAMFDALNLGGSDIAGMVTIPGAPWSKSRPRFARGHAYQPGEDRDAEGRTAVHMRKVFKRPLTGNVGIGCLFYRPNRQRIDTDNLIKHVCDAATGVIWNDDSQATAVMGVVELDAENPRTVIIVGRHVSSLKRGTDATRPCAVCAAPISLENRSGPIPRTCSPACRAAFGSADLSAPVPCGHCAQPFRRRTSTQKFCGVDCRIENLRDRKKSARTPRSRCQDCNAELTHLRGGRCRACWLVSPKTGAAQNRVSVAVIRAGGTA